MTETSAPSEDATKYWDYLLAADQDPRTLLLVAAPVALAFLIGVAILIARRLRRNQEDKWLHQDMEKTDIDQADQKGDNSGS